MDALEDSANAMGIYAGIHDHAIYTLGYGHYKTVYFGRM